MAHRIVFRGRVYHLSIAEIADDSIVDIHPFVTETASTAFIPGTVMLNEENGKIKVTKNFENS